MNIDILNRWLTLSANIAVLTGILFLAYELQQNTNVAQSSTYATNIQEINSWRSLLAADEELALIFMDYIREDIEDMDRGEAARLRQIIAIPMTIYENGYFSYQRGVMGDSEWSRLEFRACEHYQRMNRTNINLSAAFTQEFNEFLTQTCN